MRVTAPRFAALTALATLTTVLVLGSTPAKLQFLGMNMVFGLSKSDKSGLWRQTDCSLTQYGFSLSAKALVPATNFQDTLHQLAGLGTKADVFANGCKEPARGIQSTSVAWLGKSTGGSYLAVQGATDQVANLVVYAGNLSKLTYTSTTLATNVNSQVLAIDVNKDGFLDVVASGVTDPNTHKTGIGVFISNGDGTFKPGVVYEVAATTTQAFIADDFNGDGNLDLLVPNTHTHGALYTDPDQEKLSVFFGKPDGTFTVGPSTTVSFPQQYTLYGLPEPITTGDFNGDGKVDAITMDGNLHLGNGDGTFGAGTPALLTGYFISTARAVGDFNGDGKLDVADLISGLNPGGLVTLYLGNGDGTFTRGRSYASTPEPTAIAATDIDGDGRLDLVVARASNGFFGANGLGNQTTANTWYYQVLMGNGDGSFVGAPVTLAGPAGIGLPNTTLNTYALADFHKTGHLDLLGSTVGTNTGPAPKSLTILRGTGDGSFGAATTSPAAMTAQFVAAADLNGDGNPDAVAVGDNGTGTTLLAVLFGAGNGTLSGELDYPLPGSASAIQLGDYNGDGLQDIAVAVNCTSPCAPGAYVAYGQANHTFSAPALLTSSPAQTDGGSPQMLLASGDLNADGIADLIVVNSGSISGSGVSIAASVHVYLGKSSGGFTSSVPVVPTLYVSDAALADINKDGKQDLIIGATDQGTVTQVDVLLGHGDGTFGAAGKTALAGGTADPAPHLAVADFDGDGNPDVAFFLSGDFSGVLFGKGDGTLPTQVNYPIFAPNFEIGPRAVDLNGDSKPDLIYGDGNTTSFVSLINQWGLSSGGGSAATTTTLTATPNPATTGQSVSLTATVAVTGGGAPTGTVNFLDGSSTIGSSAVNGQGTATLSLDTLTAGTHPLTAEYAGDTSFAASTSTALSLVINQASAAGFSVSASPTSGSVAAGQSVTSTLTVTPEGGFTGDVSLSCSGLPTGSSCSFSPSSVSLNGTPGNSTLTIATATRTAAVIAPSGLLLALFCLPLVRRRRTLNDARRAGGGSQWGLLLLSIGALGACHHGSSGGGSSTPASGTPAGTYTITVTATAGSTSHTLSYQLTVT